ESFGTSKLFTINMNIEPEKVYAPYLLFGKKRYAGVEHTFAKDKMMTKINCKGVDCAKTSTVPILKNTQQGYVYRILRLEFEEAHTFLLEQLNLMVENKFPMTDYVIIKKLKGGYTNTKNPPSH